MLKKNIIFFTQSTGINIFWNVYKKLNRNNLLNNVGFFVTNKIEFDKFKERNLDIKNSTLDFVKEWTILKNININKEPNYTLINSYEKRLNTSSLWEAIIASPNVFKNNKRWSR